MRELIENAGIFAWPLGLCSLLATIIIIERIFALRKSSIIPRFYEVAFSTGSIPEHGDSGSVAGRIVDYFHQGKLDAEQLKAYTRLQVTRMERGLFILEIVVSAAPLIGMFTFGNLLRECGVVERLSKAAQNEIINIVTVLLGLAVGSRLQAEQFLTFETLGILALGAVAFSIGTAAGVIMGKIMNRLSGGKVNPLIGAAGVSAVPMAARVVNRVGLEANQQNFLLMHAMGPIVAGVIGSAVAAGILLTVTAGL